MRRFKGLFTRFKNPSKRGILANAFLTVIGVACALTCVFIGYTGWLSYLAYAVAACLLGYSVYIAVRFAPKIKVGVKGRLKKRAFTKKLTENYAFRALVFAACSLCINLGFVAFNTVFALLTGNAWYASLAGYYFLLSGLRGGLLWRNKRAKKRAQKEREYRLQAWKNYRLCGVALFLLDLVMTAAVILMVLEQKPTKYTEITAIVFAAFSFYKITLAIYNAVRAKKSDDAQIRALRSIGLVDAAISLLSLQTTLVATFSQEGESMLLLNALVGAGVCLLCIGVGVYSIVKANKEIQKGREEYE